MLSKDDELKALLKQGLLVIISAPSGTGKTTLCKELCLFEPSIERVVSRTTRPPRPQEVHGREYFFVTSEAFKQGIKEGLFIEWAEVHGHLYGTPLTSLEKTLQEGKTALLTLDVQGALRMKKITLDAVLIFLLPPSQEELMRRLRARKTESETEFLKRLKNSEREVDHCPFYDYIVVNKVFYEALELIRAIVKAERCRTKRLMMSSLGLGEAIELSYKKEEEHEQDTIGRPPETSGQ